jgi:hypothetical protein
MPSPPKNALTRRNGSKSKAKGLSKTRRTSANPIKQLVLLLKALATISTSSKYSDDERFRAQIMLGFLCIELFDDPCDEDSGMGMRGGARLPGPPEGAPAAAIVPAAGAGALVAAAPAAGAGAGARREPTASNHFVAASEMRLYGDLFLATFIAIITAIVVAFVFPRGPPAGAFSGIRYNSPPAMGRNLVRSSTGLTRYSNGMTPVVFAAPPAQGFLHSVLPYIPPIVIGLAGLLGAVKVARDGINDAVKIRMRAGEASLPPEVYASIRAAEETTQQAQIVAAAGAHAAEVHAAANTSAARMDALAVVATQGGQMGQEVIRQGGQIGTAAIMGTTQFASTAAGAAANVAAAAFGAAGSAARAAGSAAGSAARAAGHVASAAQIADAHRVAAAHSAHAQIRGAEEAADALVAVERFRTQQAAYNALGNMARAGQMVAPALLGRGGGGGGGGGAGAGASASRRRAGSPSAGRGGPMVPFNPLGGR